MLFTPMGAITSLALLSVLIGISTIVLPVIVKNIGDKNAVPGVVTVQTPATTTNTAGTLSIPTTTTGTTNTPKDAPSATAAGTKPNTSSINEVQPATSTPMPSPSPEITYTVNEQFSGNSLNSSLWEAISYPKAYRNNEEQRYDPVQVAVGNGALQLTAKRDSANEWVSGEVHSKWAYKYGEFEVRMRVSAGGNGIWPAAWLLGSTGQWPDGGEIDIMENVNGDSSVHGTIHGGGSNGHWQLPFDKSPYDITVFHTYKMVKQPNYIAWYVDDVKKAEWTPASMPAGGVWPFESHSYFGLMNLAIGGTWPNHSDGMTPDPVILYVDYFTVKNGTN